MQRGLRAACAPVLAVVALAAGGCGGDGNDGGAPRSGPRTLTIYSSLPLHGPTRERSRDMVSAIKLALQQSGGRVGPLTMTYVSLDSSTAAKREWTSDRVLDNARTAVRDLNTIAYIGELHSAATALSLPLTNEGHVLQVSPASTYAGLTRPGSRRPAEPERFYPSGQRTFARVVPADHVQASALVAYMKSEGARSLALLADRQIYGGGLAAQLQRAAAREGIEVLDQGRIDARRGDLSGPARNVAETRADAFVFAGTTETGAARIFNAVASAEPRMLLFGPGAVADDVFVAQLSAAARPRMRVTSPTLPLRLLPPAARTFAGRFRATFGRRPAPQALHAYEAASAILHAIRAAAPRGNDREAVRDAFFAIRDRDSVLGRYSIDRFGDTTLSTYGANRIRGSQLVFDTVLEVAG